MVGSVTEELVEMIVAEELVKLMVLLDVLVATEFAAMDE